MGFEQGNVALERGFGAALALKLWVPHGRTVGRWGVGGGDELAMAMAMVVQAGTKTAFL